MLVVDVRNRRAVGKLALDRQRIFFAVEVHELFVVEDNIARELRFVDCKRCGQLFIGIAAFGERRRHRVYARVGLAVVVVNDGCAVGQRAAYGERVRSAVVSELAVGERNARKFLGHAVVGQVVGRRDAASAARNQRQRRERE